MQLVLQITKVFSQFLLDGFLWYGIGLSVTGELGSWRTYITLSFRLRFPLAQRWWICACNHCMLKLCPSCLKIRQLDTVPVVKKKKKNFQGFFLKQRNKHIKAYLEFLKKWLPKVWSGRLKGLSLLHGFR